MRQARVRGFVCMEIRPSRQDVMGPEGSEVRPCCARPPPRDAGSHPGARALRIHLCRSGDECSLPAGLLLDESCPGWPAGAGCSGCLCIANGSDARCLAMNLTVRGGGLFHVEHSSCGHVHVARAFTSGWSLRRCSTWNIDSMPCAVLGLESVSIGD